ncbi:hypothetical protein Ocin01_13405 [Orchesella cincta]|uniref:Uncharacterized protein n=1 Tax=Orchesella cincta TaxID=48709 RepID=A0A1D2MJR1_ORCCI|nr:hypothetical protein Ocin01_13405 [Orchesella cincta]
MLVRRLEQPLRLLSQFYKFMPVLPIDWNSDQMTIFPIQNRKRIPYYMSMGIVSSLWLSCVYTLGTQPWLHRKTFGILHFCILTTGFGAFSTTLIIVNSLFESSVASKLSAVNCYMQLESDILTKYEINLSKKKKLDPLDIFFFVAQLGNGVPFLILFGCLFWDLDGPYWVIEDLAPTPLYRESSTILLFLLIRALLLLPGFWETTRSLLGTAMIMFATIENLTRVVTTLTFKVKSIKCFFRYYTQLSILCNILEGSTTRLFFVTITTAYFLLIQWTWVCVRGFGKLEAPIYFLFLMIAFIVWVSAIIFLPEVMLMGEAIAALPHAKRLEMKRRFVLWKTKESKIAYKRSLAIRPFKFQYGNFYPMGRKFSRNTFENGLENIMTLILLFDIGKQ